MDHRIDTRYLEKEIIGQKYGNGLSEKGNGRKKGKRTVRGTEMD